MEENNKKLVKIGVAAGTFVGIAVLASTTGLLTGAAATALIGLMTRIRKK